MATRPLAIFLTTSIAVALALSSGCASNRTEPLITHLFAPPGGLPVSTPHVQIYNDAGPRQTSLSYRNGVPHGVRVIYDAERQPIVELTFVDGVCRGVWTNQDDAFLARYGLTRDEVNANPTLAGKRMMEERPREGEARR